VARVCESLEGELLPCCMGICEVVEGGENACPFCMSYVRSDNIAVNYGIMFTPTAVGIPAQISSCRRHRECFVDYMALGPMDVAEARHSTTNRPPDCAYIDLTRRPFGRLSATGRRRSRGRLPSKRQLRASSPRGHETNAHRMVTACAL
jgi:hypothetical protein